MTETEREARHKLILLLHKEGLTNIEIADRIGCNKCMVDNVINAFQQNKRNKKKNKNKHDFDIRYLILIFALGLALCDIYLVFIWEP